MTRGRPLWHFHTVVDCSLFANACKLSFLTMSGACLNDKSSEYFVHERIFGIPGGHFFSFNDGVSSCRQCVQRQSKLFVNEAGVSFSWGYFCFHIIFLRGLLDILCRNLNMIVQTTRRKFIGLSTVDIRSLSAAMLLLSLNLIFKKSLGSEVVRILIKGHSQNVSRYLYFKKGESGRPDALKSSLFIFVFLLPFTKLYLTESVYPIL